MACFGGEGDLNTGGGALHCEAWLGKAATQGWPTAILAINTRIVIPWAVC